MQPDKAAVFGKDIVTLCGSVSALEQDRRPELCGELQGSLFHLLRTGDCRAGKDLGLRNVGGNQSGEGKQILFQCFLRTASQ